MHILLHTETRVPAPRYGGVERIVMDLGRALHALGHEVTLAGPPGTRSDFGATIEVAPGEPLRPRVPETVDVVHFHARVQPVDQPYLLTQHGNVLGEPDRQSVFLSRRHALNHGSEVFVHNGLDWAQVPEPRLQEQRDSFHFLGKAAWRVKNVRGAIDVTRRADERLMVLGGHRLNLKMGFRWTPDRHVRFHGMVDDPRKYALMSRSRGLVFPVTWHEPFGLAVIESLYAGCPVFATPYGAIPELLPPDSGLVSDRADELAAALAGWRDHDPVRLHEWARDRFHARRMAEDYVEIYRRVSDGAVLNPPLPANANRFRDLPWVARVAAAPGLLPAI